MSQGFDLGFGIFPWRGCEVGEVVHLMDPPMDHGPDIARHLLICCFKKSKPLDFLCFAKVEQIQFTVIVDTKTVMGNQIVLAYIPFQEVLEKNSL